MLSDSTAAAHRPRTIPTEGNGGRFEDDPGKAKPLMNDDEH
jgi:hypothetical protein